MSRRHAEKCERCGSVGPAGLPCVPCNRAEGQRAGLLEAAEELTKQAAREADPVRNVLRLMAGTLRARAESTTFRLPRWVRTYSQGDLEQSVAAARREAFAEAAKIAREAERERGNRKRELSIADLIEVRAQEEAWAI